MTPWWLRPTSEGADEDKSEQERSGRETPESTSSSSTPDQAVPGSAAASSIPENAFRESAHEHDAPRPEPSSRGFAPPAEIVSAAPAPAADSPAPQSVQEPWHVWRGEAPVLPARHSGESWGREDDSAPTSSAGETDVDWRPGEPRAAGPGAAGELEAGAGTARVYDIADLASPGAGEERGEIGEARAEDAEDKEEEARSEGKRKRSRRGRGGRRKNGRAAAPAEPAAEDEEDEAPLHDEPAPRFTAVGPAAAGRESGPPLPVARRWETGEGFASSRAGRGSESYVISPSDLDSMREIVISVPDRQRAVHEERKIAVFCDFENIALGVRDSEISKFDIGLILERLLEKGKIIVKKAYADWERYSDYKRPFHEAAIELIDIPQKYYSGKNSADIKMVVDAMDLSYSKEHLDTFVILSGDSDFSPLVSKLKENNKYVIGIGVKNSSSNLLVDNCDEFIYYEDVWRDAQKGPKLDGLNKKTAEAFSLMVESIQALLRENKDVLWGSMIKQTMQRKKPSFNEGYYGYSTFSELLEDAERKNIIKLKKDQRSGTYIVTGFAKSGDAMTGGRRQS